MRLRRGALPTAALAVAVASAAGTSALAAPGDAELASVNAKGEPLNRDSGLTAISADGRYTTFTIRLGLQPGDTVPEADGWMYDARRGRGERISGSARNTDGHYDSAVSGDGRFTAFVSDSTDLVKQRTDGGALSDHRHDVFVYDRERGKTTWVSRDAGKGGRAALSPAISDDGRFVAFASSSTNYDVPQDLGSGKDYRIFVYDRKRKKTELASVSDENEVPDQSAWEPSISGGGRHVTYYSKATNLAGGQDERKYDVFRFDLRTEETTLVSVPLAGPGARGGSYQPDISADGNLVAFSSLASDLVPADPNGSQQDIFVRDIAAGTTRLVTLPEPADPAGADNYSDFPSISADGRYVAFHSAASNLAAGDTNGELDVFRTDLLDGTTELVSMSIEAPGRSANADSTDAALSADGQTIAFVSKANDVGPEDGRRTDVFVRKLGP